MFKLPKCKYCGEQTKIEIMENSFKNSYDIVCSKCKKHQPLGFIKTWLLVKFNKKNIKN